MKPWCLNTVFFKLLFIFLTCQIIIANLLDHGLRAVHSVEIGNVVTVNGEFMFQYSSSESTLSVWPGWQVKTVDYKAMWYCYLLYPIDELVPYDGVPTTVLDIVATPLVVVVFLLSAAGIMFAFGCFVFNFKFREKRCKLFTKSRLPLSSLSHTHSHVLSLPLVSLIH